MPNHVTNRLIITGPQEDITKFKEECFTHHPRTVMRAYDGRVICRDTTAGDRYSVGWYNEETGSFYQRGEGSEIIESESEGLPEGWEYQYEEAYDHFDFDKIRPMPDDVRATAGKPLTMEAQKLTMGRNWYDWCSSNEGWGTKWNSYDNRINVEVEGLMEIMFDTAWAIPAPVIATMVEKYPTLNFAHAYYDEGGWFWGEDEYAGGVKTKDGFCDSKNSDCNGEYANQLAYELKGWVPDEDEEEDED